MPRAAAMPTTFDVERFEHVAATAETTLLRLSGRWRADQRERLSPPMLVVDDGSRTHRLAALPGPEDAAPLARPEGPRWRAALSAPAALVTNGRTAFALDAGKGAIVDLPRPVEGRRARVEPAAAAPLPVAGIDPGALAEARAEAERRAHERREAMRSLETMFEQERSARIEAERRATQEAAARERLESETARAGARLDELDAEVGRLVDARVAAESVAQQTADELRQAREALERYLASEREMAVELEAARTALAGERTARSGAQAEAAALRSHLADTQAERDALEAELAGLSEDHGSIGARLERAERHAAEHRERIAEAEADRASLQARVV